MLDYAPQEGGVQEVSDLEKGKSALKSIEDCKAKIDEFNETYSHEGRVKNQAELAALQAELEKVVADFEANIEDKEELLRQTGSVWLRMYLEEKISPKAEPARRTILRAIFRTH